MDDRFKITRYGNDALVKTLAPLLGGVIILGIALWISFKRRKI